MFPEVSYCCLLLTVTLIDYFGSSSPLPRSRWCWCVQYVIISVKQNFFTFRLQPSLHVLKLRDSSAGGRHTGYTANLDVVSGGGLFLISYSSLVLSTTAGRRVVVVASSLSLTLAFLLLLIEKR